MLLSKYNNNLDESSFIHLPSFLLISFFLLSWASPALAQNLQIGAPTYQGNGCPANSASVITSPDGLAISILFDQYVAEAGGTTSLRQDEKNCTLNIPIVVPQGYSATIYKIDYRGYNSVPQGGNSKVQIRYTYSRRRGLVYTKVYPGGTEGEFIFANDLDARSIVWSACGEKTSLNIDAQLEVRTNHSREAAYSSIDSADATAGIKYFFQIRRCPS